MLSFSKQVIQDTNTYERAGSIVRRLAENEIALTLYTDGGQLTVSTSIVVWPIILWLNELPGKVRQSFKNAVWVSLWFALFVSRARTFISVKLILKHLFKGFKSKAGMECALQLNSSSSRVSDA